MLEVLSNAVNEVLSVDPSSLSDASLHDVVVDLQRQIDLLTAAQSRVVAQWDARRIWSDDGSRSAGHRLARETGMSIRSGKALVRRARCLLSMSVVTSAFVSGELSTDRVDLLVKVGSDPLFSRDESLLVDMTKTLFFDDAQRALRYWSQCADEAGSEQAAQRLVENRFASLSRSFAGTVDLQAGFDPIGGEIFSNVVSCIEDELFRSDWKEGSNRTAAQRRCDALVEMAKRAAGYRRSSPKPLISILVGYESLKGRICETASGVVLTPGQILPLLSEADFERVVFDGPSRVIDISHKRRFMGAVRKAIEIRDRRCQHRSGCDVPADQCQTDHVQPHSRNGATALSNGQLLCATHNRLKGDGYGRSGGSGGSGDDRSDDDRSGRDGGEDGSDPP